jgi:hypothetical protein
VGSWDIITDLISDDIIADKPNAGREERNTTCVSLLAMLQIRLWVHTKRYLLG